MLLFKERQVKELIKSNPNFIITGVNEMKITKQVTEHQMICDLCNQQILIESPITNQHLIHVNKVPIAVKFLADLCPNCKVKVTKELHAEALAIEETFIQEESKHEPQTF